MKQETVSPLPSRVGVMVPPSSRGSSGVLEDLCDPSLQSPFTDLVVFLHLVVLTSFKTSESCPLPPQVGDCLSLLVLLEGQRCRILGQWCCCGEGIFPSLSRSDPFFASSPIFSYGKLFSEGSSLMESRAVVLAPPC